MGNHVRHRRMVIGEPVGWTERIGDLVRGRRVATPAPRCRLGPNWEKCGPAKQDDRPEALLVPSRGSAKSLPLPEKGKSMKRWVGRWPARRDLARLVRVPNA